MVENKFDCLGTLPDDSVIQSSADAVIRPKKNIRKPWLSSETFDVIERKAEARRQNNNAERKRLHGILKTKAKADREAYLKRTTDEVESDLAENKMGSVFRAIKELAGKNTKVVHHSQGRWQIVA